jgi:hypothetical protein
VISAIIVYSYSLNYRFNPDRTWEEQITQLNVQHIIPAFGFIRDDNFPIFINDEKLMSEELDSYDRWTGEIKFTR